MNETATLFCGNCGKELQPGDRFCRSCGSSASASSAEAPTVVERWPAPVQTPLPASQPSAGGPARSSRPSWLIPVVAGAALLLGTVVVAVILLSSGSEESISFNDQVAPVVEPVVAASATVGNELSNAEKPADLAAVNDAAGELQTAVSTAYGAATVLEVEDADAERLAAVRNALTITGEYASRVAAAAESLSPARAKAAGTAGAAARNSWATVAAQSSGLIVPGEQAFTSAEQLATVAEDQRQQQSQQTSGTAAARAYVEKIDRLLTNSAETRGDLGALIGDVQQGTISSSESRARIAAIINQRQGLQNAVASVDAPVPFRRSSELLRASITAALDDDFAIQGWINAWFDGDSYSFDRFYGEHEQATARATAAKRAFVEEYNRVRARVLKLGPAPSGDRY
jgi:hypothetical protein